ncbi:MAG: hypothetical protein K0U29_01820 [Gammaproteobacteria bacterium]|nr:hypothetical protein [Gammaproteobacteria bacterium]MCH9743647.1 hypothetical protein [Gammaproteobacteria bacterium]
MGSGFSVFSNGAHEKKIKAIIDQAKGGEMVPLGEGPEAQRLAQLKNLYQTLIVRSNGGRVSVRSDEGRFYPTTDQCIEAYETFYLELAERGESLKRFYESKKQEVAAINLGVVLDDLMPSGGVMRPHY